MARYYSLIQVAVQRRRILPVGTILLNGVRQSRHFVRNNVLEVLRVNCLIPDPTLIAAVFPFVPFIPFVPDVHLSFDSPLHRHLFRKRLYPTLIRRIYVQRNMILFNASLQQAFDPYTAVM